MEAVFLKLLNMSITAGWIVLILLLLRPFLKKIPKWIVCLMWVLVAVRLILPFSIESIVSLIPSKETIPQDIVYQTEPAIYSGIDFVNSAVNSVISNSLKPTPVDNANPLQVVSYIATWVWIIGVGVMLLHTLVSYIHLRLNVMENAPYKDNIRVCDHISTPFILGVLRPKIYLPSNMNEKDMEYVIAHEKAHLKRRDHWWKPLGFILLAVYWFNPLVWVAYILMCRDIEMACDEKVIGKMSNVGKVSYSEALLNCSVTRKSIAACPLAFGEVGVKKRIKSVLNYKKPAFWIMVTAIVVCTITTACFLTDPVKNVVWQENDSDYKGVSLSITSADYQSKILNMELKWENNSEETIAHGEVYTIYRKENGEWVEWVSNIAHLVERGLKPGNNYSSSTSFMAEGFQQNVVYRVESEFSIPDMDITEQKVWVEFCLKDKNGVSTDSSNTLKSDKLEGEEFSNDDFEYTVYSDGYAAITNYTGENFILVIPEEIDGNIVDSIYLSGEINEKVTQVVIPKTISYVTLKDLGLLPNLNSIVFKGDAPGNFMSQLGIYGYKIPKDLNIYYSSESHGFTSPVWNGFKCTEVGGQVQVSTSGEYQYVTNADNTVTIFRYLGDKKDLVIPKKIGSKKVTAIGAVAFAQCDFLTSVTIPDTVAVIGTAAFYNCTSLTTVKGGKNLKAINNEAFSGCSSLSDITLPEGLNIIGETAFYACNIKHIDIPGTVKAVERGAFYLSSLESVSFGEGVEIIGGDAFADCKIRNLVLPKSMKEVVAGAFQYCPLEQVTLNHGLESIGYDAFRATHLTEIVVPATVKNIDNTFASNVENKLEGIKFEGNAPENFKSEYGILNTSECTIYYHEGASGFTSPEWNGYKTALW